MSKQEESIKNCPFCGSSVSVERVPLEHYKGCAIFKIKCLKCGCERTLMGNDSVYRTEEEARANAIAQWNERPSPATVPREMSAREFLQTMKRMCYGHGGCGACPMEKAVGLKTTCASWRIHHPDEAIAIVKKWAEEHPEKKRKTYAEDFKKRCPNHIHNCGMPIVCRNEVYGFGGRCTVEEAIKRGGCSSCWNEEMEDEDE